MGDLIELNSNVVEVNLGVDSSKENFKELIEESASTSIMSNPMVTWAKFILTDDKPNKNGVTLPQSEFANIIKSGIHMPIKMANEDIAENHDESIPIGVITNLKQVKNQIIGLAAFWNKERTNDVELLKEKFASGEQINVSWEIACHEKELEDGGIEIENASLRAATIVGLPAYGGRTPILEMASKNKQEDEILDELKELQDKLEAVTAERDSLQEEITELKSSEDEAERDAQLKELQDELETLRKFKQEVDAEKERTEKLSSLKQKFVEAGIEKDEEYFVENSERLIGMTEEAFDFMLQELVAFAPKGEQKASEKKAKTPNFQTGSNGNDELTEKELAIALRESLLKKE